MTKCRYCNTDGHNSGKCLKMKVDNFVEIMLTGNDNAGCNRHTMAQERDMMRHGVTLDWCNDMHDHKPNHPDYLIKVPTCGTGVPLDMKADALGYPSKKSLYYVNLKHFIKLAVFSRAGDGAPFVFYDINALNNQRTEEETECYKISITADRPNIATRIMSNTASLREVHAGYCGLIEAAKQTLPFTQSSTDAATALAAYRVLAQAYRRPAPPLGYSGASVIELDLMLRNQMDMRRRLERSGQQPSGPNQQSLPLRTRTIPSVEQTQRTEMAEQRMNEMAKAHYRKLQIAFEAKADAFRKCLNEKPVETDECPVCMETLGDTNKMVMRCGHQLCGTCFCMQAQGSGPNRHKCPMCRETVFLGIPSELCT